MLAAYYLASSIPANAVYKFSKHVTKPIAEKFKYQNTISSGHQVFEIPNSERDI